MPLKTQDLGVSTNIEVIDRFLKPNGCFLVDAGCGDMQLSRELSARGAAVLAIDPDPIQAEKNQQADTIPNVGFAHTGAQAIPVEDASVDGVLFSYSLHHVPQALYSDVFTEIKRILKPGGFLYIIEPVAAGALNDVMQLFHDERAVREAAQQAIDKYTAAFSHRQVLDYRVLVQFDSWDHFVNNYAVKSYNSNYSEADVRADAVRERFLQLGQATNFRFESPVRVNYLIYPGDAAIS